MVSVFVTAAEKSLNIKATSAAAPCETEKAKCLYLIIIWQVNCIFNSLIRPELETKKSNNQFFYLHYINILISKFSFSLINEGHSAQTSDNHSP